MANGYEQTYSPDPQEQVDDLVRGHLAEVHTAIPGRIESYDPSKCLADVKPLLKRRFTVDDENGDIVSRVDEYPVIPAVPVAFPRGGGWAMAWPLAKGDPCLILFSERSLDAYLDSDGSSVVDPDDARVHDVTDAVCYPGMATKANPVASAPTDHLVLGREDGACEVRVTGSEVQVVADAVRLGATGANQALALAAAVDSRVGAVESWLATHLHIDPLSGTTGTPTTPAPIGSSTASGTVFADG